MIVKNIFRGIKERLLVISMLIVLIPVAIIEPHYASWKFLEWVKTKLLRKPKL